MAAVDAVYPAARNAMAFPWLARDGLEPWTVRRLYLRGPTSPARGWTSRRRLDRKIAALRAHASQIKEPDALEERIREWAREEGKPIGVEAAEAHRVIVIEDDEDEGPTHAHEPETEGRGAPEAPTTGGLSPSRAAAAGRGPRRSRRRRGRRPARRARPSSGRATGRRPCATSQSSAATAACSYRRASSASRGHVRTRIRSRPA